MSQKIKLFFSFYKKNLYFQNIISIFSFIIMQLIIILLWFFLNDQNRKWYDVTSVINACFLLMAILVFIFNYKKNNRNIFPKSKIIENFKIKTNENNLELTKSEKIQMQILDFNKARKQDKKNKSINLLFIWLNVFFLTLISFIISLSFILVSF
ncbi:MAG: hypothetical protein ACRC9U_02435 [Metamycoplasmataceae bacterium]